LNSDEILITAAQLAQKNLLTCEPSTSISDAAKKIRQCKTSSILIKEHEEIIGIWTEADCTKLNFDNTDFFEQPIKNFMSSPVITVRAETPFQEIIMAFHRHRVRHLLVVDNKQPIGIVSQTDVIKKQGLERYLQLRKIKDNFNSNIPIVPAEQSIGITVREMAKSKSTSALVEHKSNGEFGIITERDLLKILSEQQDQANSWYFATYPLVSISQEDSLYQAYNIIKAHHFRHLVVCNKDNKIVGVLSLQHILSDIEIAYVQELKCILSERDSALKESRKSLHFAEKIIAASLDSIMVTDGASNILSVNPAFIKLTGYSEKEVIGKPAKILSSGIHEDTFYHQMWKSIRANGKWQGEIWNKKKNGDVYPEWLTIVQMNESYENEQLYAAIFCDISERKLNEKKIHELAFFDELTALPNRRLFNDRFDIALSTAHRNGQYAAVLFLDLDRFKQINDSLGHKVGDELLIAVAKRITSSIKEGDTVARFGGDEFVILITEISSAKDIICIIERIASVLSGPYELGALKLQVTSSIGAAIYPDDGEDADTLLKHADTAMYKAKDSGRNSFQLYTPEMNALTIERLIMQNYLRSALNKNEFELNYQLQVNSQTQRVVGVEALLRWNSAELGRVSPAQFIPMAEELGLIVDIDRWVLGQACKQRKAWLEQHLDCGRMSINISAQHFKHDLINSIKQAMENNSLSGEFLEIEITESCLIENIEHANKTLNKIRGLGIYNAIDDFGTGFSALSYLTQLPFNTLKIDGSFIGQMSSNTQQGQVVATIIGMAKGLELDVIAEGVETKEQVDFLTSRGCSVIQGYFFSRPEIGKIAEQRIKEFNYPKVLV